MPARNRYRTAHTTAAPPARPWWVIVPLWICGTIACLTVVAGTFLTPVVSTILLHGLVLLTVLAPALMLGMALGAPFKSLCADSSWPDGLRLLLGLALGLGALGLLTLAIGSAGWLVAWAGPLLLLGAAGAGAAPTLAFCRQWDRGVLHRPLDRRWLLLLLTCLPIAILLVSATFPPGTLWHTEGNGYDVLEYHLAAPRAYALAASTHPLAGNVYSYLPANVEMLYTLLMMLARFIFGPDQLLAAIYPSQLLHATFMLLTAGALLVLPIRLRRTGRLLAAALLLATPWIIVTGSEAYDEGGMLLFGILALGFALAPAAPRARARRAILIGLLLGLCVGSKMTAGVMVALPIAVLLLSARQWKQLSIATLVALAVYAPWALRSACASGGNPVFPVAASWLGRGPWDQTLVNRFAHGHSALEHGISGHLGALVDQTLLDPQYMPGPARLEQMLHPAAMPNDDIALPWWQRIGLLWFLVPIVLVAALLRGATPWRLALVLLVQVLAWLAFTHLQARFLLPAAPVAALLTGFAAETPVAGVLLALVAFQSLTTGGLLRIEAPVSLHDPGAWPFIGHDVDLRGEDLFWLQPGSGATFPRHQRVLLIGDARTLYLTSDVISSTVFDRNPLGDALRAGGTQGALDWLRAHHIDMVVIDWGEVHRLRATYGFDPAITPEAIAQLAAMGLRPAPLPARRGVAIYDVLPAVPSRPNGPGD